MQKGQEGIVASGEKAAKYIVLRALSPERNARALAAELARTSELARVVSARAPGEWVHGVVAFGAELFSHVCTGPAPRELLPFAARGRGETRMPATGGDVLVHVHGSRPDLCFELSSELVRRLSGLATVTEEVDGFVYFDERDLTGFIDGTENPKGEPERVAAAWIADEDPAHAGGSYVLAMRFVHALEGFRRLEEREQERIVGRRKADSEELADDEKPESAHIARVVIEEEGEELEIVRHSLPYGSTREAGLFFLAYCKRRTTFDRMLAAMLGEDGGPVDALLAFTRAVSGAYFYAPSKSELDALAERV